MDHGVSFGEATRTWARIAARSFGGPAGQIAVMHRIVVDEKKWIGEARFLHALNYCMLLPGPEAQQLATYLGWLLHGTRGGLVAGGLFVLPGFVSILALSWIYVLFRDVAAVSGLLFGLKAAVLAVVVEAVQRLSGRVLKNRVMVGIAVVAFVAIHLFGVPFPAIVLSAGLLGAAGARVAPTWFAVVQAREGEGRGLLDDVLDRRTATRPPLAATVATAATWAAIWLVPVGILAALLGPDHVYARIAGFFSGAAVVTFGGAYAVLAYVAQEAVAHHGWLLPGEMVDGLGLAETTPGPLIQVVQFVGFLAAWRNPGELDPLLAGTLGAVLTTWVTFAPCFLWIFTGAPYVEWLRGRRALTAALSAITAAVVGVVVNLSVWFALHVLFAELREVALPLGAHALVPVAGTFDPAAALLAVGAGVALLRFHVGMLTVLGSSAALGALFRLLS